MSSLKQVEKERASIKTSKMLKIDRSPVEKSTLRVNQSVQSQKTKKKTKKERSQSKSSTSSFEVKMSQDEEVSRKVVKRKLSNNPFSQQSLRACTPILTVGSAIVPFLMLSICFAIIGTVIYLCNQGVVEFQFDYTDCKDTSSSVTCSSLNYTSPCTCQLRVILREPIPAPVFMYYRIDNMYQNYMIYSSARDDDQLAGSRLNGSKELCSAFTEYQNRTIAPCGMIANSLFNDTFGLDRLINRTQDDGQGSSSTSIYRLQVSLLSTGLTLTPRYAMKNPPVPKSCPSKTLECAFNGSVSPPNWNTPIWSLEPTNPDNNGYLNERFQVWMRPAPFPSFRKLWARLNHNKSLHNGTFEKMLHEGEYLITIEYNYPVSVFRGRKHIILSNTSWLGGSNFFLAYLYIICAVICFILVFVFYLIDRKFGKASDQVYAFILERSNQSNKRVARDHSSPP